MVARYRKHADAARTEQLRLRLTPDELVLVREAGARASLTPSGYAAEAAIAAARGLDAPSLAPWREALVELMLTRGQLRRIGSNLNQAVQVLHRHGEEPAWLRRLCDIVERRVVDVDAAAETVGRLARR